MPYLAALCPWPGQDYRALGRSFTSPVLWHPLVKQSRLRCGILRIKYIKTFEKSLFNGNWIHMYTYCTYNFHILNPPAHLSEANVIFTSLHPKYIHWGHSDLFAFLFTEATISLPLCVRKKGKGVAFFLSGITSTTLHFTNTTLHKY